MKLTNKLIKRIIKEELAAVLEEAYYRRVIGDDGNVTLVPLTPEEHKQQLQKAKVDAMFAPPDDKLMLAKAEKERKRSRRAAALEQLRSGVSDDWEQFRSGVSDDWEQYRDGEIAALDQFRSGVSDDWAAIADNWRGLKANLKKWNPLSKKHGPWSVYFPDIAETETAQNQFAEAIATALSVSVQLGTGWHKIPNVPEFWTVNSKRLKRSMARLPRAFRANHEQRDKIIKKLEAQEILIPGQFAHWVVGGKRRSMPPDTKSRYLVGVPWDYDEKLMRMSLEKPLEKPMSWSTKVFPRDLPKGALDAEHLFKHVPPWKLLEWVEQSRSAFSSAGNRKSLEQWAKEREEEERQREEERQEQEEWEQWADWEQTRGRHGTRPPGPDD